MIAGEIQKILAEHLHGTVFGMDFKGTSVGIIRDGTMGTILRFKVFETIEIPIPKELSDIELKKLIDLSVAVLSLAETPVSQIKKYYGIRIEDMEDVEK